MDVSNKYMYSYGKFWQESCALYTLKNTAGVFKRLVKYRTE